MYRQCQGIPYHDIPYQVKKQVQIEWDIQGQPKLSYYLSSRYMTPGLRISWWLTRNIFLFSVHPVGWNPILEPSAMGRLAKTQWKKVSCPQTHPFIHGGVFAGAGSLWPLSLHNFTHMHVRWSVPHPFLLVVNHTTAMLEVQTSSVVGVWTCSEWCAHIMMLIQILTDI